MQKKIVHVKYITFNFERIKDILYTFNKFLGIQIHLFTTPTPWLMRIRFTQTSLTQLFKKNPDIYILNADSLTYTYNQ